MNRYLIDPDTIIAGQTWYHAIYPPQRIEVVARHPKIEKYWMVLLKNARGEIGVIKWLTTDVHIRTNYTLDKTSPLIEWENIYFPEGKELEEYKVTTGWYRT